MLELLPEVIILIFGILGVICGLSAAPDAHKKPLIFLILFYTGFTIQCGTQGFQFVQARDNRLNGEKEVERRTAMSLYAFLLDKQKIPLLKKTSRDPYIVAYRYFKEGEWEKSEVYLGEAIKKKRYYAQSNYLLAYMATHKPNGDLDFDRGWDAGKDYLAEAIKYDPQYPAPYYLRGVLRANSKDPNGALEDLAIAAKESSLGIIMCDDLNSDEEIDRFLSPLRGIEKLESLRKDCGLIHS